MEGVMLGDETTTHRGFRLVEFQDCYGTACSLQASSLADYEKPGTSAVWLGVEDAQPKVLHGDAKKLGVKTDATSGWVPYPMPKEVLLRTRMHLKREQVESLISALQSWLDTDSFTQVEAATKDGGD